jgi:quercetin dioxygenase-like cupin family protein
MIINMKATKGFVVPAGGGKHLDMTAPGRFASLKLFGHETNDSIMMFEETVPVGAKRLFHLHRDSDEAAWVLAGEITFKIGDKVSVGGPGTCAFFPRNVPHAWKSTGTGDHCRRRADIASQAKRPSSASASSLPPCAC